MFFPFLVNDCLGGAAGVDGGGADLLRLGGGFGNIESYPASSPATTLQVLPKMSVSKRLMLSSCLWESSINILGSSTVYM